MNNIYINTEKCPDKNAFNNYLNGGLSESELLSFENHLDNCSLCKESVEGYKAAFIEGYVFAKPKLKAIKQRNNNGRRIVLYAVAATIILGLFLLQPIKTLQNKSVYMSNSNSDIVTTNNKTLMHKTEVKYWYIGTDDKIAVNDQFVPTSQISSISETDNHSSQVFIQVEETNQAIAEQFISTITSNLTVPVYMYSKQKGLKKN